VSERELRRDPLSGRWSAIAPGRAARPGAQARTWAEPAGADPADCPFCEGHEDQTPPETFAIGPDDRKPDMPGWQIRVVPNLFPAFADGEDWSRPGMLEARAARGVQEVVVNAPRHVRSIADLSDDELAAVAEAWSARAGAARKQGFPYVHAIVNEGREAGASLAHTHSQLLWLPDEPPAIREERAAGAGACALCTLVAAERAGGGRLIAAADGLVALAAFAPRQPYELLVVPEVCEQDPFESVLLAPALRLAATILGQVHELEGPVPANLWLHHGVHWHLELLPRTTVQAGIELGAGIYVTTLAPEEAARRLRG